MPRLTQLKQVPAPAKLNVFLHVVGRRDDGYHLLQTVFTFVDLYDYLDFDLRTDGSIERVGASLQGLAAEDDLIIKAARLLQQHSGTRLGVAIHCQKNIPAGAGLGGGSSNAATTLIALNRLWQLGYSRQQLMQLGVQLGADVPIFIFGRSAFAQGIGEQLQAVKLPQWYYVLLRPAVFVATPAIFQDQALTRNQKPIIITDFTGYVHIPDSQFNHSIALYGTNNLQPVAAKQAGVIQQLLDVLQSKKYHARMTGSGSGLFVVFDQLQIATRQQTEICGILLHEQPTVQTPVDHWVVTGLNTHPLYNWLTEFGD